MILPGYQTSDSASSSKFHHLALLALFVALVLHYGDSAYFNFAILYFDCLPGWNESLQHLFRGNVKQ